VQLCQRRCSLFDLIVLLGGRLLSCFMTGAVGRYSASPVSPQQSIIALSVDKCSPLVLLLPLILPETFKTFLRWLALTCAVMYAQTSRLPARVGSCCARSGRRQETRFKLFIENTELLCHVRFSQAEFLQTAESEALNHNFLYRSKCYLGPRLPLTTGHHAPKH